MPSCRTSAEGTTSWRWRSRCTGGWRSRSTSWPWRSDRRPTAGRQNASLRPDATEPRSLGPQLVDLAAPREVVFDVIAEPYLGRAPKALADKLRVLDRGSDMVLAAHFTPPGGRLGLVAQTVETVRFSRPERVDFRLVRGPVPHVVEAFVLTEQAGGASTRLAYHGEIGANLWRAGQRWCALVAHRWKQTVAASLAAVKAEAERRASTMGRWRSSPDQP